MRRFVWVGVLAAVLSASCCGGATAAATLKSIGTFKQPIFVSSDPSNPDRLLVVERAGLVVEASATGINTLADLRSLVSCCEGERGLTSIAPAPGFDSSGRFYAAYAGTPAAGGQEGDLHVDSFRPDPSSGALVREPILSIPHSEFNNHNGGQLQFGPDGYLYISVGDGGSGGDPHGNGQNLETLLAKILRIEPRPGEKPPYGIPPGNPLVGKAGLDEIWAYGLRNPWRFSFDRTSGDMVIADVGQDEHEEIDYAPSPGGGVVSGGGADYGWNCREGFFAYSNPAPACTSLGGFTEPVFDYPHEDPGGGAAYGCSIIGGYVVRDRSLGDLYGRYLYTDFCTGEIRSLVLPGGAGELASGDRSEGLSVADPSSFGEDSCGRLYVTSNDGPVYRFEGAIAADCPRPAQSGFAAGIGTPTSTRGRKVIKAGTGKRSRAHLLLRATAAGSQVKIVVTVSPCAGRAGEKVQLNKGGQRLAIKRLNRSCEVRFFTRVERPSTFRALLLGSATRSRHIEVEPPQLRR